MMKKTVLLLLLFSSPLLAQVQTTVTGTIGGATSGYVEFQIQPASNSILYYVVGTQVIAPQRTRCAINSSGQVVGLVSGDCLVWANTAITPANTTYTEVIAPANVITNRVPQLCISGLTFNLSTPVFCPVVNVVPQYNTITSPNIGVNLIPAANKAFTLGDAGRYYGAAYIDQLFINNMNLSMDTITANVFKTTGNNLPVTMTHSADGSTWTVHKPNGETLGTPGSTTQGLQEAITYARTNLYPLIIYGGGIQSNPQIPHARITCTTPIVFPPGEGAGDIKVIGETDFYYSTSSDPSRDFITFDTLDLTTADLSAVQIIYGGNAAAVKFHPTSTLNTGGFIGITSSHFYIGTIAVINPMTGAPDPTHGKGVEIDPGIYPVVGNEFHIREINGSNVGFQVDSPTGMSTGFELNTVFIPQLHGAAVGYQIGTSATTAVTAGHLSGNLYEGNISVSSAGIVTWGHSDGYTVSIGQDTAGVTGVTLRSSAVANLFTISRNNADTPWVDGSTTKDNTRIDSQPGIFTFPGVLSAKNIAAGNNFLSPVTQSVFTANGSISVVGADANFALGAQRAIVDKSGSVARIGCVSGGGAACSTDILIGNGTGGQAAARFSSIGVLLNGTSTDLSIGTASYLAMGNNASFISVSAPTNASLIAMGINASSGFASINSGKSGSGSFLPIDFFVDGADRMRLTPVNPGNGDHESELMLNGITTDIADPGPVYMAFGNDSGFLAVSGTTNATLLGITVSSSAGSINVGKSGAGVYAPLKFATSGAFQMTLGLNGGLELGTPTGGDKGPGTLNVQNTIWVNGTVGFTGTKNFRAAGGAGDCNVIFVSGVATGGSC